MTPPATDSTVHTAQADSPRLLGRCFGGGSPTFVLLHGLGIGSRMMAPLALHLRRHGTVVAPDLPGFGAMADVEPERDDLRWHAELVRDWLLTRRTEQVVLVGVSLGAQTAMHVAAAVPDLRALVLASPTVDRNRRTLPRQLGPWAAELAMASWTAHRIMLQDHGAAGQGRVLRWFLSALRDEPERLAPAIDCPTLVVRGTLDPLVGRAWVAELADALPRATSVAIRAKHAMSLEAPAALAASIERFLDLPVLARPGFVGPARREPSPPASRERSHA